MTQWFAEQGFAVLVADGRGTPGRGPAWERAIHFDVAGPALADQIEALRTAAALRGELDAAKVAIRGCRSAASSPRSRCCAGPTSSTPRSLIGDAPALSRPLLLIHGLAHDNVVAAHSLRLSAALLAAGRLHEVALLPKATHQVRDRVVAENMLCHSSASSGGRSACPRGSRPRHGASDHPRADRGGFHRHDGRRHGRPYPALGPLARVAKHIGNRAERGRGYRLSGQRVSGRRPGGSPGGSRRRRGRRPR